jgi:hypothetical protein
MLLKDDIDEDGVALKVCVLHPEDATADRYMAIFSDMDMREYKYVMKYRSEAGALEVRKQTKMPSDIHDAVVAIWCTLQAL